MNKYKVVIGLVGVVIVLAMVLVAVQSIQAGGGYKNMVLSCKSPVNVSMGNLEYTRIEGYCKIIRVSEVDPYPDPEARPTVEPDPYPEPPPSNR